MRDTFFNAKIYTCITINQHNSVITRTLSHQLDFILKTFISEEKEDSMALPILNHIFWIDKTLIFYQFFMKFGLSFRQLLITDSACLRYASAEGHGLESDCCLLTTGPLCHKCAPTCLQLRATWRSTAASCLRHPLCHAQVHELSLLEAGMILININSAQKKWTFIAT